ncbi:MAG: hypothetical protein COV44_11970 [Deltaproteobacteria bacterium CG11_big_fil_rev_8_21_14_0_20_45_16]|nr:MAG: hypothetical protein COV44_11970 [Deltaproteobacteria bacterium CG11_big_fil_rev_8_21_14_0_20_45_16]
MSQRRVTQTKQSGNSIQELRDVLLTEIALYEQYASQLEGDSQLMAELKTDDLESSNKAKATILLKIQAVEQARQQVVKRIAEEKGIQEEKVKITDICATVGETESSMLMQLREKLQMAIHRIRKMQQEAGYIVRASLQWIDGSMSTLKNLLTPVGTYNASGRVDHPGSFAGRVVENKA